jgi:DNA-binding NarL/FixJ family response regulator
MTCYDCEQNIRQALSSWAKAFLFKGSHPQQIREAVRRVAQGESFLPPEIGLGITRGETIPQILSIKSEIFAS